MENAPCINTAMEMSINQGLFSYLSTDRDGYANPFDAVENYVKGKDALAGISPLSRTGKSGDILN